MNKKKIGFGVLSFVLGALIFGSLQVGARGLLNNRCEDCNLEKGSVEWEERLQERKENMGQRRLNSNKFQFKGTSEQIQQKIEIIENGIQITITSNDPETIERLQKRVK